MTAPDRAPRCQDVDLDALAYGELAPTDELWARSHIALCGTCKHAHEQLLEERRRFSARSRAAQPAPLPSFDHLLARAEHAPTRWQAMVRSWASPWRGAVVQGVVGMFAVGMLVQVAILRPPRAAESPRPRASAAAFQGGPAAAVDPWGESIPSDNPACGAEAEVCMEQALAHNAAQSAPVSDPCANASVDWAPQSSSGLDGSGDAVCVSDAI